MAAQKYGDYIEDFYDDLDDDYDDVFPSEVKALADVERDLGYPLSVAAKKFLRSERFDYLAELQNGYRTPQELAQMVREFFPPGKGKSKKQDDPDDQLHRSIVSSAMAALEVKYKNEVKRFRSEVLKDKLLPLQRNMAGKTRVENWINKTAKSDGAPSLFMDGVAIPEGTKPEVVDGVGRLEFHPSGYPLLDHRHEATFSNISGLQLHY